MATLGTFTSNQVLTAAELNAIGTWTTYNPSMTGWVIGTGGSVNGAYREVNELVEFYILAILGTSPTTTGEPEFSLPSAFDSTLGGLFLRSSVYSMVYDADGATYPGRAYTNGSDKIRPMYKSVSGSIVRNAVLSATAPITFVATDRVYIWGSYKPA